MSDRVLEALQRVLQNRKNSNFTVDGYTGFLFLTRNGTPQVCINYNAMFRKLVEKYNKNHEEALLAVTTPHTLRHTFCTKMANAGMNPKALQYLMGHANITMTLNYFTHTPYLTAHRRNFSGWRLKGKERFYYFFTTFQSKNTSRFKKLCEYLPIHKMLKIPAKAGYTGI